MLVKFLLLLVVCLTLMGGARGRYWGDEIKEGRKLETLNRLNQTEHFFKLTSDQWRSASPEERRTMQEMFDLAYKEAERA